jgi:DNA-binding response OmpR family regulator
MIPMTAGSHAIDDPLRPAPPKTPARPILVVDDDAKIVRLVRTYLEREGHEVVTAGDGRAALEAIERHRPALVVLDLMLPELDGRAVIRALRGGQASAREAPALDDSNRTAEGRMASTPVIILSARGSLGDRIAGLEDGADDYLPKPFSPAELVLRVNAILRRSAGRSGEATDEGAPGHDARPPLRHADLAVDRDRHEVTRAGRPVPLTAVEFRLLVTLIEAGGRVLSRDQLLDAVYGSDQADVLDRTIDVHVGRLRDKLDDDADRPRYVMTVRGVGYRSAPDIGDTIARGGNAGVENVAGGNVGDGLAPGGKAAGRD